jgi:hypothetical protein
LKIAVITRPSGTFPYSVSEGIVRMLLMENVEVVKFESIDFLMRLLPLRLKPNRYHANLFYRLRQKLYFGVKDFKTLNNLKKFDVIIITECYANLFWSNFIYVEALRKHTTAKIVSYTDCPLDCIPANKIEYLNPLRDFNEDRFDYNLFLTNNVIEFIPNRNNQFTIGVNVLDSEITYKSKVRIFGLLDFPRAGYEEERKLQISVLKSLDIDYVELCGHYSHSELLSLFAEATFFFMSSPESFGLAIAESLARGSMVFTPSSYWPMSWSINSNLVFRDTHKLDDNCFKVYSCSEDLEFILISEMANYSFQDTPKTIVRHFNSSYSSFYKGDQNALKNFLECIETI